MTAKILTQKQVQEILHYDPDTGIFHWKHSGSNRRIGIPVGTKTADGYLTFSIKNVLYKAHRVAWLYSYGFLDKDLVIDHINGKRDDNRLCNLRLVTHFENMQNIGVMHTPSKLQKLLKIRENT